MKNMASIAGRRPAISDIFPQIILPRELKMARMETARAPAEAILSRLMFPAPSFKLDKARDCQMGEALILIIKQHQSEPRLPLDLLLVAEEFIKSGDGRFRVDLHRPRAVEDKGDLGGFWLGLVGLLFAHTSNIAQGVGQPWGDFSPFFPHGTVAG